MRTNISAYEILCSYLIEELVGLRILNPENLTRIFLKCLEDFFQDKIKESDLSAVAGDLYYVLNNPKDFDTNPRMERLGRVLFDATELAYYHKNAHRDIVKKQIYKGQLKSLKDFFEENKGLIKKG
jgi:hypothetical protein